MKSLFEIGAVNYIIGCLAGIGFLYRLVWLIASLKFQNLSKHIEDTDDKFFNKMKNTFAEKIIKNKKVNNVDAFVDKMLYGWTFCGLKLSTYRRICGLIFVVVIGMSCIFVSLGGIYGIDIFRIISTILVGSICITSLIIVDILFDCKKRTALVLHRISEFLSNEYVYQALKKKEMIKSRALRQKEMLLKEKMHENIHKNISEDIHENIRENIHEEGEDIPIVREVNKEEDMIEKILKGIFAQ